MLERSSAVSLSKSGPKRWERTYAIRLEITDFVIISTVVFGSQFLRFGMEAAELRVPNGRSSSVDIGYSGISLVIVLAWVLALRFFDTRGHKVLGAGSSEYKRVADATVRLFGLLAIAAFLLKIDLGRAYILLSLPLGLFLLLFGRWGWRQWLLKNRAQGKFVHRVILLGHRDKTGTVATSIRRDPSVGFEIVGAITPNGSTEKELIEGVPVLGAFRDVVNVLDSTRADVLVLTGADEIGSREMRRLGWDLEKRGTDLVVAPALTDVAGPRIHARPLAGLPLIYVDFPSLEGRRYLAKRAFDVVVSLCLIVVSIPLLLVIAVLIKKDSRGPVFFSQERVGLNGQPFRMLKFRSMVSDAEELLPSLLDKSEGNEVLFKMKDDPRITKIGTRLRKHSLDELPQLINVIRGDMSLVGPRPPLAREVGKYDDWAKRRLLVKPGITGLWQVNGRSSLSWSDSIRLDLYYVENWSLTGDIIILYRTLNEVIRSNVAY